MYQKEWALAESYATKLIGDATNYNLVKPYSAFFANNAVATPESVFELSYSTTIQTVIAINGSRLRIMERVNGRPAMPC